MKPAAKPDPYSRLPCFAADGDLSFAAPEARLHEARQDARQRARQLGACGIFHLGIDGAAMLLEVIHRDGSWQPAIPGLIRRSRRSWAARPLDLSVRVPREDGPEQLPLFPATTPADPLPYE